MRDVMLGVLGAAVAYPLVWYGLAPEAEPRVSPAVEVARPAASAPRFEREPSRTQRSARTMQAARPQERREAMVQPVRAPARPSVDRPTSPVVALPAALPKTIDEMSALQRVASDPRRLAESVQTLESNEQELAELRAFAEMFVEIPPDRVEERVSGAERRRSAKGKRE